MMLAAALLLTAVPAEASNVDDSLVVGIQSSKTLAIRPLEPVERDFMSIYDLMYDGLMVINDDYLPECALAEEYSTTNGKNWTFKLRDDLYFSDGQPVTANDVVATAQWILNKAKSENSADLGYYVNLKYFVDTISAEGEKVVKVKAERAYFGLLYAMTFPILPAYALELDNPPGTGPYIAESFQPGMQLQLIPNTYWWQSRPKVSSITFVMHEKAPEVIESYEYARVDTIFTRAIASAQYKGGTSSLALDYRTNQLELLMMNHGVFPLDSKSTREAIRYLIDVDKIANQIYNGMVERTDTPIINGTWMYNEGLSSYFRTDPAKAIALLDADGWSDTNDDGILDKPVDGESVSLTLDLIVYEEPDDDVRVETANMIADMLGDYGIEIKVVTVSMASAQDKLSKGAFDLCLASFAMDVCPDPGFLLMNYNTGNYGRYRSDKMTELCNTLRKQVEQEGYQQVLMQIQEQFAKDCPFICLFYRSGTVLTRRMYTTVRDVRELELLKGIESFRD